jgi:hypothetical protein
VPTKLFPSDKAQVVIQGALVTRRLPQAIRYASGSFEIRQYLMTSNLWTEKIIDNINWDAHGASHLYHWWQRCYLIKMVHRHLPVGKTVHRRNAKYSPICPGCRTKIKTQDHYIQCLAPSRIQWRIRMLAAVRQVMERLKTDLNLQEMILNCINSAISERAIIIKGPFHNALDSQSKIGWIDMIQGYWSSTWQIA